MTDVILHRQLLDNGLELIFKDLSNRYYGDFYQVKIEVIRRIPLSDELLVEYGLSAKEQLRVKNSFGDLFVDRQELKRMGVAGPDVTEVGMRMVQQFLDSALPYMSGNDFPACLLRRCLSKHQQLRPVNG